MGLAPSGWMLAATVVDLVVVTIFAARGTLMAAVPLLDVGVLLAAVLAATLVLDFFKVPVLARSARIPRPHGALRREQPCVTHRRP